MLTGLPSREIDKLKARVQELEAEINTYKSRGMPSFTGAPSPPSSASPPLSMKNHPKQSGSSHSSSPPESSTTNEVHDYKTPKKDQWEGIYVATARSDQASYWGPASTYFFISRIGRYLGKSLQKACEDRSLLPRGASRALDSMTEGADPEVPASVSVSSAPQGPSMSRMQEEYFLGLFWESYHCVLPIVDEVEFRRHYNALWEPGKTYRRHSALVDIVIALCVQYGYTFIKGNEPNPIGGGYDDATIAGRWYYRRCQSLLSAELESPSITTVQCQIFSIVYLCCASFQNMTHVAMATTIRSAQIVGLHLEPPIDMPQAERELRKRIWWCLSTIEIKSSMKLGRPISLDISQATVTMPADDIEAASLNGATLGSYAGVTWLKYTVEQQKLIYTTLDVYRSMYGKASEIITHSGIKNLYKDPQGLESCAELVATKMPALRNWLDQVPAGMKTQRRNGGEPYATDRTPLDLDPLAPTWLQHQRVCLELMYHSMCVNLHRPFVTFAASSGTYTPIAERHASTCVNHAIAHTFIMHQAITEANILSGWSEYFLWQWNAAVTIIGFILAYPVHPAVPHARKGFEKTVDIFDKFGENFAVAASAASIARDLMGKADVLSDRLRVGVTTGTQNEEKKAKVEDRTSGVNIGEGIVPMVDDDLSWLDPSQQDDSEFMDWALTVDAFNSFDRFFDQGQVSEPFMFGQL